MQPGSTLQQLTLKTDLGLYCLGWVSSNSSSSRQQSKLRRCGSLLISLPHARSRHRLL